MSDAAPSRDSSSQLPLPVEPIAQEAHRRRAMLFLGAAVAFAGVSMAIQQGLNENFVVQVLNISPSQRGFLESFRESCGILALGVLALLAGFAEPIVAMAMLLLVGVGLASYSAVPGYAWLVGASLVWSLGLHVWMPLPNSMTLALAEPGRQGRRMAQIQTSGAAGAGIGYLAAMVLTFAGLRMRPLYIVAGGAAVLAGLLLLGIPRRIRTPGPRLVFRRKYSLYYVLCFLEGWRKQISICFAGYLMVRVWHAPVELMLTLWMATQAIGYYASPFVGRLIDRVGERKVLLFYYASLTAFFVGYAFVGNLYLLCALYVVDNAFFVFGMSLATLVGRLAPKEELTPTLSMGVAMNHVAAVIMPFLGAFLWGLGYHWVFLTGVAAAGLSILASRRVPRHEALAAQGERASTP